MSLKHELMLNKDMSFLTCIALCVVVAVPYADLLKLKLTMVSGGQEGRAHVHFN
jgi:hypothetical protein